jgi:hypothetical protein
MMWAVNKFPMLADSVRLWVEGRFSGATEEGLLLVAGDRRALSDQLRQAFAGSALLVTASVPADSGPDGTDNVLSSGLFALAKAAALALPALGTVVEAAKAGRQMLDAGNKLVRREGEARIDPGGFLLELLSGLTQAGPAVVLVEDLDRDGTLWELLTYLARHEPGALDHVALIAAMEGPQHIDGPGVDRKMLGFWSPVVARAVEPCDRRDARWVHLPGLSAEETPNWLGPMLDPLPELLVFMCGGDDHMAGALWAAWVEAGYVARPTGVWQMTPGVAEPIGGRVWDVLSARCPGRISQTRSVLDIASLFGDKYSETVVAQVAAAAMGIDESEAVDLLDGVADDGELPWLVKPVGHVGPDHGGHWRYRFASPLLAGYLRASADPSILPALFDAALAVHGGDDRYLDDLARLARLAGQLSQAAALNARVATRIRLSQLRAHALALLAVTDHHLPDDAALLRDAWLTTQDMHLVDLDSALAADLGERAVTLARKQNLYLAESLFVAGRAAAHAGRGTTLLGEALDHNRGLYDTDPTPDHRRNLAATLGVLGEHLARGDDAGRGLTLLEEAVVHVRGLYDTDPTPFNRQRMAATLHELGGRLARGEDAERGLTLLEEALDHNRGLYDTDPTPATALLVRLGPAQRDHQAPQPSRPHRRHRGRPARSGAGRRRSPPAAWPGPWCRAGRRAGR